MKLYLFNTAAGPEGVFQGGKVHDFPAKLGQVLLNSKAAALVDEEGKPIFEPSVEAEQKPVETAVFLQEARETAEAPGRMIKKGGKGKVKVPDKMTP